MLGHIGLESGTSLEDEQAADKWAADTLIPAQAFENFRKAHDYSANSVKQFAKEQDIAPGILVGRMQNNGMIKYTMLNGLKEKYNIAV